MTISTWFHVVPRMFDSAHYFASLLGVHVLHTAGGPRQTSISDYVRLSTKCSCTQILVPRSFNQSALGCRSIYSYAERCENDVISSFSVKLFKCYPSDGLVVNVELKTKFRWDGHLLQWFMGLLIMWENNSTKWRTLVMFWLNTEKNRDVASIDHSPRVKGVLGPRNSRQYYDIYYFLNLA